MDLFDLDTLKFVAAIVTGFIASYFGYRQVLKKSEVDQKTSLMLDVNEQNAQLREYLSRELKDTMEKSNARIDALEQKVADKEKELEQLKRDKEHLEMKLFKIRLFLVKEGYAEDELDDI